jgi:hypothetical protein
LKVRWASKYIVSIIAPFCRRRGRSAGGRYRIGPQHVSVLPMIEPGWRTYLEDVFPGTGRSHRPIAVDLDADVRGELVCPGGDFWDNDPRALHFTERPWTFTPKRTVALKLKKKEKKKKKNKKNPAAHGRSSIGRTSR